MTDELDPLAVHPIFAGDEALSAAGWRLREVDPGYPRFWSFEFGEHELTLEPLTFGRVELALYRYRELVWPAKLEVEVPR